LQRAQCFSYLERAGTQLASVGVHVHELAQRAADRAFTEGGRRGLYEVAPCSGGGDIEPEPAEERLHLLQQRGLLRLQLQRLGEDERLHLRIPTQPPEALAEPLVVHPLVRRMLIDDEESLPHRAEQEGVAQLSQGG